MSSKEYQELTAMLAVIYKRIEDVEYKIKGGSRSASLQSYADELRKKAATILPK